MIRKTSAMVEAGILAAVAIVMALISMYVPVLGAFINFLWPLPIVICGCRHGFKWSLMTLIVAGLITAMIISPINAFFLVAVFGILGLILGECMRRHLEPMQMMLYGSIGGLVAMLINLGLSFVVLGINPIDMMFASFDDSLVRVAEFYRNNGMSEEETKKAVASLAETFRMMRIIMPGAFMICAPIMAFVNYVAAKKILKKLGESFEDFPDFIMLKVPGWILWPYMLSLFGVTYFYQTDQNHWLYTVFVNIQTVCSFALVFQGIVLLYWYVISNKKPRWWANIGTALLFVVPLFSQILVYVGAFDIVMDFRKIRGKSLRK